MAENDNNDDDGDHLQPLPAGRQGRDGLVYTLQGRGGQTSSQGIQVNGLFFSKIPETNKNVVKRTF